MDLATFSAAMERRGCVGNQKTFCGSYNGYPFSVAFADGKKSINQWSVVLQFNTAVKPRKFQKALRGKLSEQKPSVLAAQQSEAVSVSFVALDSNFDQYFDAGLAAMVDTAKEMGLEPPRTCPLCGAPGCDSYAFLRGSYRPAHATCVQNMAMTSQSKAEKNQREGSYLLGFVGAVLGAVVGAIPSILTIYFLELIVWLLYALVPLASYQGYKLLRGKLNRAGTAIVIAASVLTIPVVYYIVSTVQYYTALGVGLPVADFIFFLRTAPELFIRDLGTLALGTAIGIAIMWGGISKTSAGEVRDASFSAVTLRPIQPAAAAPAAAPVAPAPEQLSPNV